MNTNKKILLAEDFAPARKIMSEILTALGYEHETAANGFEVIFALKESEFGLILLDLQMPLLDGFETLEHVRRNFSYPKNTTPIIAMTGREYASELVSTFEDEGFDGVIEKPFSLDTLDNLIKSILEEKSLSKVS